MSLLKWDPVGEHKYRIGEDKPVLFPMDTTTKTWAEGVAWNGLTTVTESPSGADESKYYANNKLYLSVRGLEDFGFSLKDTSLQRSLTSVMARLKFALVLRFLSREEFLSVSHIADGSANRMVVCMMTMRFIFSTMLPHHLQRRLPKQSMSHRSPVQ